MSFTDEQKKLLEAKLDARNVKSRSQAGRSLSYIEGWHAIAEANRIFGHDGWSRETVETTCVWSGDRPTKNGPKPAASYIARVRITAGGVVRDGTGAGSGFGNDHGEAHESALKEAETDATKRALMTFGWPFGLALYDKDQEHVDNGEPAKAPSAAKPKPAAAMNGWEADAARIKEAIRQATTPKLLDDIQKVNAVTLKTIEQKSPRAYDHLMECDLARRDALQGASLWAG